MVSSVARTPGLSSAPAPAPFLPSASASAPLVAQGSKPGVAVQSRTISQSGQAAIREVFGFDPGRGVPGAYTYDERPAPPGAGFSGNAFARNGVASAFVYPEVAGPAGVRLGLGAAGGKDYTATQEVAQKLVFGVLNKGSKPLGEAANEVVGDAVSMVQYPEAQALYLVRFNAQALLMPEGVPARYAGTSELTLKVLGSVAAKHGGRGGEEGGRVFLADLLQSVARDGDVRLDAITPKTIGAYGQRAFGADPAAFNAEIVDALRENYKRIGREFAASARP